jgi:hypothetical protein
MVSGLCLLEAVLRGGDRGAAPQVNSFESSSEDKPDAGQRRSCPGAGEDPQFSPISPGSLCLDSAQSHL